MALNFYKGYSRFISNMQDISFNSDTKFSWSINLLRIYIRTPRSFTNKECKVTQCLIYAHSVQFQTTIVSTSYRHTEIEFISAWCLLSRRNHKWLANRATIPLRISFRPLYHPAIPLWFSFPVVMPAQHGGARNYDVAFVTVICHVDSVKSGSFPSRDLSFQRIIIISKLPSMFYWHTLNFLKHVRDIRVLGFTDFIKKIDYYIIRTYVRKITKWHVARIRRIYYHVRGISVMRFS